MRIFVLMITILALPPLVACASEVTVYKWQDQQGHWHYGEKAPKQIHKEVIIDTEANVTSGNPFAKRPPSAMSSAEPDSDSSPSANPGVPYSPGRIRQMLDEVKGIQKNVETRSRALKTL